ncbi:peptide deformylase [Peloplasma aerotolerans]|jgi:peptide deformylase|uniref:Peptide deformylase n=1 Tax=Peloplasma aerotolerans TaxID=3044389 RepID=A0AAW6UAH5_9MOLU|nr:peptide deformylase [Mariniplasma sp. M4Ah]MDI6452929.1 peptide deformylase [Mariniplasma sp. M4Ah]
MILMKNIIREGHKTLETVAKEVKLPLSKADKKLLIDLLEYVKNSQDDEMVAEYGLRPAVGIAAPQVNVSKRMFAVHVTDFDGTLYSYALVNPVLKERSTDIIYIPGGEGCLSVDRETEGITPRYQSVTFEALSYDLQSDQLIPIEIKLEGYVGIVFQHEFDHINGIMYTTKLFKDLPNANPAFEYIEQEEHDVETI